MFCFVVEMKEIADSVRVDMEMKPITGIDVDVDVKPRRS